ncbi:MAG TPA: SDR family NAD(P)-dependent oxidoreductase [Candidatus Absconditabacterales bacterium]|nr:SDR family NAD(P)-dependent oxidoreductase [Candidatus Absconditabacterales bacterium]
MPINQLHYDITKTVDRKKLLIEISRLDIDSIICCAGGGPIESFHEITEGSLDKTINLNLNAYIYLLSSLALFIKKHDIDIVLIGATIGFKANDHMPAYSISKRGLRGLIENLRSYMKESNSRIIGIHVGGMSTESNIGPSGRETLISKKTGKNIPTSLIDPKDVALLIKVFLELPKHVEVSELILTKK